jgi:hypothetical protein
MHWAGREEKDLTRMAGRTSMFCSASSGSMSRSASVPKWSAAASVMPSALQEAA